jgi:Tol biopolymer transport system component
MFRSILRLGRHLTRKHSRRSAVPHPRTLDGRRLRTEPLEERRLLSASVLNITSLEPDGRYEAGAVIDLAVEFSEPVAVAGTPTLKLETGQPDRVASYLDGSGSPVLTFRYTVEEGDTTWDLSYTGPAALDLAGGTIQDSLGNDAILTLPDPYAPGSLGANKALVIAASSIELISAVDGEMIPTTGMADGEQSSLSDDGRYVAFSSSSAGLIASDTNGCSDIFVMDRQTGVVTRVSTDSAGLQANGKSSHPSISADGRYVAFQSDASNLVVGDTNGWTDVFVKDTQTGTITRVNTDNAGAQASRPSSSPSMSGDARYVAFQSEATNLVPGHTGNFLDIFIKELQTGAITCASTDSSGALANGICDSPSLSNDGRYVAFESYANNLVPGTANDLKKVLVKEIQTGAITCASTDNSGVQANASCYASCLSSNGSYVAFYSYASNLVPGDTGGLSDVFLKDLQTGTTSRVNTDSSGAQANANTYGSPSISSDGHYVVFYSQSQNLVPEDTNGVIDVFVKNMQTGAVTRASTDSLGVPSNAVSEYASLSGDGRVVAFSSYATNLVPGDRRGTPDLFAKDTQTGVVELCSPRVADASPQVGAIGTSSNVSLSGDGRFVAFSSDAGNLVADDTNNWSDVFIRDAVTGALTRVSTDSSGTQGNGTSLHPSISVDGRYVAFCSAASNLAPQDPGWWDIFVKDLDTGAILRASTDSSGARANDSSYGPPSISSDGRYVAFFSSASNLVPDDTNGLWDVFVKDTQTGAIIRVSTDSYGNEANASSEKPRLSADGRYVAFLSSANNLVPGIANGKSNVFVKDLETGVTTCASTDSSGILANDYSNYAEVSANGRYVVFGSHASNLVSGDTNGMADVFVKDIVTGAISRVSTTGSGNQANDHSSTPSISSDGRYVAFYSSANNLVPGVFGGTARIFVKDTQTGAILCVNTNDSGVPANDWSCYPSLSSDGPYVAFESRATNLDPRDMMPTSDIYRVHLGFNDPPVAIPGGPYFADLGAGIMLDGSGSYDPNASWGDSIASYAWDIAGGTYLLEGVSPSLTPAQVAALRPGTYSVVLTVTDQSGATGTATAELRVPEFDLGDAPHPSYPTLVASNAARHVVGPLYLGSSVDGEMDGQPTAAATGDDLSGAADEDGVTLAGALVPGHWVTVTAAASAAAKLDAWIDWNADGDWADPGEQILVSSAVAAGDNPFNVLVPQEAVPGPTYARFRLSTAGGLEPTGLAEDGEVEDYRLEILAPAEIRGRKWNDGDGDGLFEPDQGERGIWRWTIFLDSDADTQLDPDEPFTLTDEEGNYAFLDLPPGDYEVAEVWRTGWQQVVPAIGAHVISLKPGEVVENVDFGNQPVPLRVIATDPQNQSRLLEMPVALTVDFSVSLDEHTLAADGLMIDGQPFPGYTLIDADTVRFDLPALAEGRHTVEFLGGSIASIIWAPLEPFDMQFIVDTLPPAVTINALRTTDATPPLAGTVDDPEAVVQVTLDGQTYTAANHGDGTWTLADDLVDPPLPPGLHDAAVTATDAAGRTGQDDTENELDVIGALGAIDDRQLVGVDLSQGDLWFQCQASREGLLTIEVSSGEAGLVLYSDDFQAISSPLGARRIDQPTDAKVTYYFTVTGAASSADLRLINLVQFDAENKQVTVAGTANEDSFAFDASNGRKITVNGIEYNYTAEEVASVSFDGGEGEDSATVIGTPGNDSVVFYPSLGTLTTSGLTVSLTNITHRTAYAGEGDEDLAYLYGSNGDDQFTGRPGEAVLSGSGYESKAVGFDYAYGIARLGDHDVATFYDDPAAADEFISRQEWSSLKGEDYFVRANGFDEVTAYATPASGDAAMIYGSSGDDTFTAYPEEATISGSGITRKAEGFDYVHGVARGGGYDKAYVHGLPESDKLIAQWDHATFQSTTADVYLTGAWYFDEYYAYGEGGSDTAYLHGRTGQDDKFLVDINQAQMTGYRYNNRALGFRTVYGYAETGAGDFAQLDDSPGANTFTANPAYGYMTGGGYYFRAEGFDYLHGRSQFGGGDTANFTGSTGDDTLVGRETWTQLSGPGYLLKAWRFGTVNADATTGVEDRATLYDSALADDLLADATVDASLARVSYGNGNVINAKYFDFVVADGSKKGGNTKKVVPDLAYVLFDEKWL